MVLHKGLQDNLELIEGVTPLKLFLAQKYIYDFGSKLEFLKNEKAVNGFHFGIYIEGILVIMNGISLFKLIDDSFREYWI